MEFINIFNAENGVKYKDIRFFFGSIILAVVFCVLYFVIRKSKRFVKGEKVYSLAFAEGSAYLKRRKLLQRILSVALALFMVTSFLSLGLLFSRPYVEEITEEQKYSRDIILCMDVSTSVCKVNENLCKELKKMVKELEGDRFGIIAFNTSPVLMCPMTDNVQYIMDILDQISHASKVVDDYVYHDRESSDLWDMVDYLYEGTAVTGERGSSFSGDGLASSILHFPKMEEDRSRVVIYTSDNDYNETGGKQYLDIISAAKLCKERKIVVYGIGTTYVPRMEDLCRPIDICMEEMKQAVELTGGMYYLENEQKSFKAIVDSIQQLTQSAGQKEVFVAEHEHQEMPILLLTGSLLAMFITVRILRK